MPPKPAILPDNSPDDVDRLAHDLRTAIAVAKGNTQLLQRRLAHPDGLDRGHLDLLLEHIDKALTAAARAGDALVRRAHLAPVRHR